MAATTTPQPPAFPQTGETIIGDGRGMTLRDYFAAAALQGMCGSGELWPLRVDGPEMAERAFLFADAMLAERAKGQD